MSRWQYARAATLDFFGEYWRNGIVRVYGITLTVLSITTILIPSLSPETKALLAPSVFGVGLVGSLLIFIFLPQKYFFGLDPQPNDLIELKIIHDNEAIAKKANDCARAHFGKTMGFPYAKYREWRQKNPFIFTAFVTRDGTLIGFADVFPLTKEAAVGILEGRLSESELTSRDIYEANNRAKSNHIYIASVVCCARSSLAESVVLSAAINYVQTLYPTRSGRSYIAVGGTADGQRVLNRLGFFKVLDQNVAARKRPVYCMRSEELRSG